MSIAIRAWSVIAVLCSVIANVASANDAASVVANPSFEIADGGRPAGWRGDPAVYSQDNTTARSGKASLHYANDNPGRYVLCTQGLPLKPGWRVRASAWIKTKDLAGGGATICLEWTDKSGKWLGGCYPHAISGTADWTRIEVVTRVPAEAGTVSLSCYARRGSTGQAWFDDVEVVHVIDAPMSTVLLSPGPAGLVLER